MVSRITYYILKAVFFICLLTVMMVKSLLSEARPAEESPANIMPPVAVEAQNPEVQPKPTVL